MRGIKTNKSYVRTRIFEEIAKLAYDGWDEKRFRALPFVIVPGETAQYRDSIFVERAVVSERLRAAMGLSLRDYSSYENVMQGMEASLTDVKYYEPPLIDIIKFACNCCPEKRVFVSDGCQHCLEHPCKEVCPKKAISIVRGRSVIDEDMCIKCGQCISACPYHAIIKQERPCAAACGMKAIHSDELGRAEIDREKCVSCGQCLVNCPFGAIIDKSQLFQTITAIREGEEVYAAVAPAMVGQYGSIAYGQLRNAIKQLGFKDVYGVAIGADLCTIEEAKDFLEEVPEKLPFMATSCCPAWAMMAKKLFPKQAECISMALTPMVLTARLIKRRHPEAKICFVGPCAAKKLEASRHSVRSDVDFVLTFEEFDAMFKAKGIEPAKCEDIGENHECSGPGIGFAVSGGVAAAVQEVIRRTEGKEINVAAAEGLANCRKLMTMAKAGKYDGYLLEGMACPGGCINGAGVIAHPNKAAACVATAVREVKMKSPLDSKYIVDLDLLEE